MDQEDQVEERYILTYSFYGDDLPIHELGKKLGVKPKEVCEKGEHRHNNQKYAKYETFSWHSPIYRGYNLKIFTLTLKQY